MCDEMGVLMPNENANNRDIRSVALQGWWFASNLRGYDPLQYPLIFSYSTNGWHINLKLVNDKNLVFWNQCSDVIN